jgi:hypothetical protein
VFHPEHRNLFVMGMIEATGLGWEGRSEQAEMVALYIRQQLAGGKAAQQLERDIKRHCGQRLDGGYRYLQLERMAYYVHKDSYRRSINRHIQQLQRDLPQSDAAYVR